MGSSLKYLLFVASVAGVACVVGAGCTLDLGEVPFKCNTGSPKCPKGYTCHQNTYCLKEGFCPEHISGCDKRDAGIQKDGPGKKDGPATQKDGPGKKDGPWVPPDGPILPPDSGPVCGNNKCEPPWETSSNCPQDCGSTGCTSSSPAQCIGTKSLKYCNNGQWKTDTCQNLCVTGGYGYADSCKVVSGQSVCLCGGGFGDPCNNTTKKCASSLICVNFNSNPNLGFCTKECYTAYSICTGAPTGTYAECSLSVSTPTGTKKICGFICSYSQKCPAGLTCDYSSMLCKP